MLKIIFINLSFFHFLFRFVIPLGIGKTYLRGPLHATFFWDPFFYYYDIEPGTPGNEACRSGKKARHAREGSPPRWKESPHIHMQEYIGGRSGVQSNSLPVG